MTKKENRCINRSGSNLSRGKSRSFPSRAVLALIALVVLPSLAKAQKWVATPPFEGSGAGTAILRTDGSVLVQELSGPASQNGVATGNWYLFVPDQKGNYSTGSWHFLSTHLSYAPLYFASAVLPDGRVIIEGGEYDFSNKDDTTQGAILGLNDKFTAVGPPANWSAIGDAPSVILPNGNFMMGDCCSSQEAILNAKTLTWTSTGNGKLDTNSEEGWTLLPDGDVLTIDTQNFLGAELYHYKTGNWTAAKSLPFPGLTQVCQAGQVPEIGPAVLRPDGTVFASGANGFTMIYNSKTGTWSKGPLFPSANGFQFGVADGPAALLPNGHVLVMASSIGPCYETGALFYSFDGTHLNSESLPPNSGNEVSFDGRMVVLPTGNVLFTDGTQDVEIYVPVGSASSSWAPTITSFPSTVSPTKTYTLKGTQFNGLSQGAAYGDDAQSATNFPLVRIKNKATGDVFYAITKNFSSGVATGSTIVSTQFTVTGDTEIGNATLVVIANGIASKAVNITVQ
jgi:hypothetical protein